jgi:hypothetical protein
LCALELGGLLEGFDSGMIGVILRAGTECGVCG